MKEKVNVYQMVTDRVIEQLENQLRFKKALFIPESDAFGS